MLTSHLSTISRRVFRNGAMASPSKTRWPALTVRFIRCDSFPPQRFCVALDICRDYPCARPTWWNLLNVNAEFLGQLFGTGRYALARVSKHRAEAWTRGLAHDGRWRRDPPFGRSRPFPCLARLAYCGQYLSGRDSSSFFAQGG